MYRYLYTSLVVVALSCRPPMKTSETTIAGTAVVIEPISGAHVRATMLTADGPVVVGETTTGDDGTFEIPLFAARGVIQVEVLGDKGGTTHEPLSQKELGLSYTDRFSNLMASIELGHRYDGIVISPWSTLVAEHSLGDMETNGVSAEQALLNSVQLFQAHFGGLNFLSSVPLDPSAGPMSNLSSAAVHGFITTALAAAGNDQARRLQLSYGNLINAVSLTQWLAEDVRDLVFDSKGKNGPIVIIDDVTIDLEFTRNLLAAALGSFLTSPQNMSGLGLTDLTALINSISADTSPLYGLKPSIATSEGDGPKITLTSPISGSTLRDQVIIAGKAEGAGGVAGVEVFLDGNKVSGGDRVNVTEIDWAIHSQLTDGFHAVKVTAQDSAGKTSSLTVTFQSDATPPTIKFAYCSSFDDRARTDLPRYDLGAHVFIWHAPSPPDQDCTAKALGDADHPYLFHTFAELAKAVASSSSIAFVPLDTGPISSAQADIVFSARLFKGPTQVGDTARIAASPNSSAREVALSSALFGAAFLDLSSSDVIELRLSASDVGGNTSSQSYYFAVDFLPTPIAVTNATPPTSSSERLEHYSFAAGNAPSLFDSSSALPYGIVVVQRYSIFNPSDRAIALHLALSATKQPSASYAEWTGFVAGERVDAGTLRQVTAGPDEADTPDITISAPWGDGCYNDDSNSYITRADLSSPSKIYATEADGSNCVTSDGLLSSTAVATATSAWLFKVHTPEGALRFPTNGDYVVGPNETLQVSIGFPKPSFPSRTINACIPNYKQTDYAGHTGGRTSGYYELDGYGQQSFLAPLGLYTGVQTLGTYETLGTTWQAPGWTDCSGISCSDPGCRVPGSHEYLLRVLAAQGSALYCSVPNCTTGCWPTNCQRQAWREWHQFALSKTTEPYRFDVSGSATIATASRLVTNPILNDFLLAFPSESYSVKWSDTSPRAVSSSFESMVFTKGTLP